MVHYAFQAPWLSFRFAIRLLYVIALSSLLFVDILFYIHHPFLYPTGDEVHYDGMATLLLTKGVYSYWLHPNLPDAMTMPGYPLFLAIIYHFTGLSLVRYHGLWLVQFMLFLCDIALLYQLGRQLSDVYLGMALSLCIAFMPFCFAAPFRILTENLALPAFLLYLNLLIWTNQKPYAIGRYALCGLSIAICALIRANLATLGLIPLLMLLYSVDKSHRIQALLLFFSSCAFPLLPWWIRNLLTLHAVILFDRGEAANTLLAGTYPGYPTGIPHMPVQGVNQLTLAKQRILHGLQTHPWRYILWYTVWRFHDLLDMAYLPLHRPILIKHIDIFLWYQKCIVWGSLMVVGIQYQRQKMQHPLRILWYSNLLLFIFLLPFHPEPRFAIYNVVLCGILLIRGIDILIRDQIKKQKSVITKQF